ncbi:hypothetical protein NDU88_006248 [Pleurodeles waltl]|uniref:Uncharacterized protein n=1 Tax=Pleurodeles waltl TaxID=8319 RepID=A0AAV7QL70_PLEWA|nr:hypothetical protein NDU88_006248 [Pleurodeles waltl]
MAYHAGPSSSSTPTAAQDDGSGRVRLPGLPAARAPPPAHKSPGGSARPGAGAGAIQWPPLTRHSPITSCTQAAWSCPRRGTRSSGYPPSSNSLKRATPRHNRVPARPQGCHAGPVRVPDRSPGGAHRQPTCSAHLFSSGLTLPPPGQQWPHANLATGRPRVRTPPLPHALLHIEWAHRRSAWLRRPRPTWLWSKSSAGRLRKST